MNLSRIFADVQCFASLEGAKNIQLSEDGETITYDKRHLYNYSTPATVTVARRESARGAVAFTVKTTWTDVSGETRSLKSRPQFIESQLYHEICAHCRAIIA
jgi:hypothetical protein